MSEAISTHRGKILGTNPTFLNALFHDAEKPIRSKLFLFIISKEKSFVSKISHVAIDLALYREVNH